MFLLSKVVQGGMKWHFLWFFMLPIWYIFMSPIQISAIFQKITGPLKMNTYFRKFCKYLPITSKNNHQNKFKIVFFFIFARPPKMSKLIFNQVKGKQKIRVYLHFQHFKNLKKTFPPHSGLKDEKRFN